MENAVQSLLQVPNLPSANVARALLLRAKGRLAAGFRTSAQQGKYSSVAFRRASVTMTSETHRQIFIPC
jgi:hypothetical protein